MKCLKPKRINEMWVICGKCLSCKIRRRSSWTMRMLHHLESNPDAVFVTLTYNDEQVVRRGNGTGMLVKSDLQKFMKRLRINRYRARRNSELSFYGVGEYGEMTARPHYHLIIYGLNFCHEDVSDIDGAWGHGHVHVDLVTPASIRYVAAYIDKKILGYKQNYEGREPEFQLCSNEIGRDYAIKHMEQLLYEAGVRYRDKVFPLGRYYKSVLREVWPEAMLGVDERLFEQGIDSEIDLMAEIAPQFGGRSYEYLDETERSELAGIIYKRNKLLGTELEQSIIYGGHRWKI